MDAEQEGEAGGAREEEALENLLVPPAAILESLPDAVVAANRDGRIVFVNALAEELFGYPSHELIGQPVQTIWPVRVRERGWDLAGAPTPGEGKLGDERREAGDLSPANGHAHLIIKHPARP